MKTLNDIKNITILGAGAMGPAIAQVFASGSYKVTMWTRREVTREKAKEALYKGLQISAGEKLIATEEVDEIYSRVSFALTVEEAVQGSDLIIETIIENSADKMALYEQIEKFASVDCLVASNTSTSNVFSIAGLSNAGRFLIAHWFNPAYLIRLVEVVRGPETSDEAVATVTGLLRKLGKTPCVLQKYVPGFIVNRLANALFREAGSMVSQGLVTAQDIDEAIKATNGLRYAFEGPMALFDVVGWDLILAGCRDVFPSLCNENVTSEFAENLVKEGKLGVKTLGGVYDYSNTTAPDFLAARSKKIVDMYNFVQTI